MNPNLLPNDLEMNDSFVWLYKNAGQAMGAGATTKVTYPTPVITNKFQTQWDTTNSRYYATKQGLYLVIAKVMYPSTSARSFISIYKNGAEFARGQDTTSAYNGCIVTALVPLFAVDDYIEIFSYTASAMTTSGTSQEHNYLQIIRLTDIIEN